jgi:hypothetical protein
MWSALSGRRGWANRGSSTKLQIHALHGGRQCHDGMALLQSELCSGGHLSHAVFLPSITRFFTKKVGYNPENDPALPYVRPSFEEASECSAPGVERQGCESV